MSREENDFYATEPSAVESLLLVENVSDVLEPACGQGHISKVLLENNIKVSSYDLIDRGFGEIKDFFEFTSWQGDIVTNPPYKIAQEFIEHALDIVPIKRKVIVLLKLQFLESLRRKEFFDRKELKTVYVPRKRVTCAKHGDFETYKSSPVCYAWFVFEKGYNDYPTIKWI